MKRVKETIAGVVDAARIRTVIAHGSWVRGDFWPKSDLDLIVVGVHNYTPPPENVDTPPDDVLAKLKALGSTLGVEVESWGVSEDCLAALRTARRGGRPITVCGVAQFDINGFDVVDRHGVVWGDPARDPLHGLPVPRGCDLQDVAIRRLRALPNELSHYPEANRVACDALKAATIFFLLKAGRKPTRDKREVLDRFFEVVPDFGDRATARVIWALYQKGDKKGDVAHGAACKRFVDALVKTAEAATMADAAR